MFPVEVDLWFDWHLTNRCNFYCDYCHPQIRRVLNKVNLNEPEARVCAAAFDSIGATCGILMSGGEPFAFPNFSDLCYRLTRRHYIAINTNLALTAEIAQFVKHVPPTRVARILAAIHVGERIRNGLTLDDFVSNYRTLTDAGFDVTASYVLHPALLSRAEADFEYLRKLGVQKLEGKVFKGVWDKRRFPIEYNEEELASVRRLTCDYAYGEAYLSRRWKFSGLPCRSGVRSFKVSIVGDVQRCVSVQGSLGNLYDGTFKPWVEEKPCTAGHVLVLSECAEHLVSPPKDLQVLLGRADEHR